MMRILFVDDEMNVLHATRRALSSMRGEWDMEFLSSATEALRSLDQTPADVIVSDMRMPGMDGWQLLAEVKRLHPQTVRLVLSGYAEPGVIMRLVGTVHQYIAKPADSTVLKAAIAQTQLMRRLLTSDKIAFMVGRVGTLPSFPKAFQEISACLKEPNTVASDAARIISRDVAMTANIMKLVNSAFFGARRAVSTVDRAVAFLGLDTLTALVMGHGLFLSGSSSTEALWQHSLQTAMAAREIAQLEHLPALRVEEAFLSGILHDVGRLIIADGGPGGPGGPVGTGLEGGGERAAADEAPRHAEVGGYLLGLWGFPSHIVAAVAQHHTPRQRADGGFDLTVLVHIADRLAQWQGSDPPSSEILGIEPGLLEEFGLLDRLPVWAAKVGALVPVRAAS